MHKKYVKLLLFLAALFICISGFSPGVWALPGDIDESGRVDGLDLIIFSRAFGTDEEDAEWNPSADLNLDGAVNDADLSILRDYFGRMARSQGCWVADYQNNRVVLIGASSGIEVRQVSGLNGPVSVGVNLSNGMLWIANKGANQVIRVTYDSEGSTLTSAVNGFSAPNSISVNSLDGSCWVADSANNRVVRLDADTPDGYDLLSDTGHHREFIGFSNPSAVSVDPNEGNCWVADTANDRIVMLLSGVPDGYDVSADSGFHAMVSGFNDPLSVSADTINGNCWVADTGNNQVAVVAPNGIHIIKRISGFSQPRSVSINPLESACWVADYGNHQVVKLSGSGNIQHWRADDFQNPISVSAELSSGACWVADYYHNQIVKLSSGGSELLRLDGFYRPIFVLSIPGEEPPTRLRPQAVASWEKLGNLDVRFDAGSSSDIDGHLIRYEWDFEGDGIFDHMSSDAEVITHTYAFPGIYNPVLRVTDNDWLTDSDTRGILQLGQLTAIATAEPYTGTVPLQVSFTGRAIDPVQGSIDNYRWDFDGDGEWDYFNFTTPNTSHTYSTPGSYKAVFQVTNTAGDTALTTLTIQTFEAPPTAYASANPGSGNAPFTTQLQGSGSDPDGNIELYQWDLNGDGVFDWFNLSDGNTYNTYAAPGSYTPVFQVTDNSGLADAASTQVTVAVPQAWEPQAVLQTDVISGNAPLSIQFDGSASTTPVGTIDSYKWDFGDGQQSTGANVSHDYTQAGSFTASLTVTNNQGGSTTASETITVYPQGTPPGCGPSRPLYRHRPPNGGVRCLSVFGQRHNRFLRMVL